MSNVSASRQVLAVDATDAEIAMLWLVMRAPIGSYGAWPTADQGEIGCHCALPPKVGRCDVSSSRMQCPGCGAVPDWNRPDFDRKRFDVEWDALPDGRYIGAVIERGGTRTGLILHECPYRGGGGTGDREPRRPLGSPPRVERVEPPPPN
jgi:hypothetical protein